MRMLAAENWCVQGTSGQLIGLLLVTIGGGPQRVCIAGNAILLLDDVGELVAQEREALGPVGRKGILSKEKIAATGKGDGVKAGGSGVRGGVGVDADVGQRLAIGPLKMLACFGIEWAPLAALVFDVDALLGGEALAGNGLGG